MDKLQCILCYSNDIIKTESINTNDLVKLYRKRAGVDVRRFFAQKNIDFCSCKNCGLKFYWPQAIGDGMFYDELQQYRNYYLPEKAEFIEATKHITNADEVLEIGCGEGIFTNFIEYKSYTGLEFSDKAIIKAGSKGLNVLKQTIEEHSDSNKEKYDAICCFQVLEHVKNPNTFISDCIKCLKHGGKLIIAVPSEDSFINQAVNFYLNMPPHHATRWSDDTLKKVADIFRLELIHIFHEQLHQDHKLFYLKTIHYRKFISLLRLNYKSVNLNFLNTLLYSVAVALSSPLKFIMKINKKTMGQSVFIIYKK